MIPQSISVHVAGQSTLARFMEEDKIASKTREREREKERKRGRERERERKQTEQGRKWSKIDVWMKQERGTRRKRKNRGRERKES